MNIEFEVKNIIREDGTPEQKADRICSITTFSKGNIINGLRMRMQKR